MRIKIKILILIFSFSIKIFQILKHSNLVMIQFLICHNEPTSTFYLVIDLLLTNTSQN
jgi:hypothetical protein